MDEKIWSSLAAYVYQAQSLIEKIDFEVKEVLHHSSQRRKY
jgi:hypothetical protein